MSKLMTSLSAAVLVLLAGCDAQLKRAQKIALPTLLRDRPCSEVPLQNSQLSLDQ